MATNRIENLSIAMSKGAADLRHDQLLSISASIIEQQGLEALSHANIAKIAGCTRPLVYRYFPKKTDIYRAITAEYYQGYAEVFSDANDLEGIFTSESKSLRFLEGVWSVIDRKGIAALLLRDTTSLSEDYTGYLLNIRQDYEKLWSRQLEAIGIPTQDATLLLDSLISCIKHIAIRLQNGELTRAEVVRLSQIQTACLVEAFKAFRQPDQDNAQAQA